MSTRRINADSRASLLAPTTLNVIIIAAMPASAITSASPSFWTAMPRSTQRQLRLRHPHQLVGLDVRTTGAAGAVAVLLPALEIGERLADIDERHRCFQSVDPPADVTQLEMVEKIHAVLRRYDRLGSLPATLAGINGQ